MVTDLAPDTPIRVRPLALVGLAIAAVLAAATVVVAVAEAPPLQVPDAAEIYIVAVVAIAATFGTAPAILTSIASVLIYDFLFIEPRGTLTIDDPREWLDLALLLLVAVVVGRLVAHQRERSEEATRLAAESHALFAISRTLATGTNLDEALPAVVRRLAGDARLERVWITLLAGPRERMVASTDLDPRPVTTSTVTLVRPTDEAPARWVRAHSGRGPRLGERSRPSSQPVFRVKIESEGELAGSIWATRAREAGDPSREETRLLSLAADQVALALRRDRLARDATEAEIARRSDALKSALIDSVSHDLRTPLASIRATAGSLHDPAVTWTEAERRAAALTIDGEAERLDRLVRNLLDLGRIEAGELRPDIEVHELRALVEPAVDRLRLTSRTVDIDIDLPDDLPLVAVDAVFLDAILSNLLENAARHAPGAPIRIGARAADSARVDLAVEDGGPGVPDELLTRLFDRFYRVPRRGEGARHGMGIGLSVVRGLVRAMGGDATASRSELGGLAIHLALPAAPPPDGEEPDPG